MVVFSTLLFFATTFVAVGLMLLLAWFALQKLQAKGVPEVESPQAEPSKLFRDDAISSISIW